MAETFNPYRVWLGIPPRECPPNHYRLLGIELFEEDRQVIRSGAERQARHVRSFQSGAHAADSVRIVEEIIVAHRVLSDPQKKAAYDERLREHLKNRVQPAATVQAAQAAPANTGPAWKKPALWVGAGLLLLAGVSIALLSQAGGDAEREPSGRPALAATAITVPKMDTAGTPNAGGVDPPAPPPGSPAAGNSNSPVVEAASPEISSEVPSPETTQDVPEQGRLAASRESRDASDSSEAAMAEEAVSAEKTQAPVERTAAVSSPPAPSNAAGPSAAANRPVEVVQAEPVSQETSESARQPLELPPLTPAVQLLSAGKPQKVLGIIPKEELDSLRSTCKQLGMTAEFAENFDARRRDYRGFQVVVVGSNRMDYFSKPETKTPEAFQPIVDFVTNGGHLLMFGTYHGRNMEHLQRFGIHAGEGGNNRFERIPGVSEVLFAGNEDLIPKDNRLESAGRFVISRPHAVLLKRGPGNGAGEAKIATTPYGEGRVTIMMVEPHWKNDLWVFPVMLSWHLRGAPSRSPSAGLAGFVAAAETARRSPLPEQEQIADATKQVQTLFEEDYRQLKRWNAAVAKELARKLVDRALTADDPVGLRYGLLAEARNLAETAGDAATVLNAIEATGRVYDIDVLAELEAGLGKCASSSRLPGEARTVVEMALIGMHESMAASKFDTADSLLTFAGSNARRARSPELPRQIAALKQQLTEARRNASAP